MNSTVAAHSLTREAGSGRIVLRVHGAEVIFAELSCVYPLKLLSPRIAQDGVAVAFMLTYGGGLVSGDSVALSVDVGAGTTLMLLSQGSTKVFKTRPGYRASVRPRYVLAEGPQTTTQSMDVHIADTGTLVLLPDPVTCFRSASYHQMQTFHLTGRASAVLLDWITSGRRSLGEEWAFSRYVSINEVFIDGKRIARDAMLLEDEPVNVSPLPRRVLADRLAPYSCYATLIIYGPSVEEIVRSLDVKYRDISIYKHRAPPYLLWSLSPISGDMGRIVRVAGKETEDVKNWLRDALQGLERIVGVDVYRKAFV
ncbi:hypothetical protein EW146_g2841 [Bondarzewia mesenterica]|uniref:Urease accessory protein UreD n=1 Tax=Bondarzewia mesenterica TaxID=1095465 RepID=A0A4S4M1P6_9AGAM|nr:hypothetical protein EW146_g2841 [Bondarzewia mesenterica]